jgi:hypothetical protein
MHCNKELLYSITPSARSRTASGTSRSSAFAVLRLSTVSYFTGRPNRQVSQLLALEDAIDVTGGAPELADQIGAATRSD